jgi:hypothetical protein
MFLQKNNGITKFQQTSILMNYLEFQKIKLYGEIIILGLRAVLFFGIKIMEIVIFQMEKLLFNLLQSQLENINLDGTVFFKKICHLNIEKKKYTQHKNQLHFTNGFLTNTQSKATKYLILI